MKLLDKIFKRKKKKIRHDVDRYEIIIKGTKSILREKISIDDYAYNVKRWEIIGHLRKRISEKDDIPISETKFEINPIYK